MKSDILTIEEVKMLVDRFYDKVRDNSLLKDIFNERIQDRWPIHLEKMYRFWQTVLLEEHTYDGNPFAPHANMPVSKKHFDQWIALFVQTVDENFEGNTAEEAKWRAHKMAEMFQLKINYYQNRESNPL